MKGNVSPAVTAVVIVIAVALLGFLAYRMLVPQKVLLAPGTKLPPMPSAPAPPGQQVR